MKARVSQVRKAVVSQLNPTGSAEVLSGEGSRRLDGLSMASKREEQKPEGGMDEQAPLTGLGWGE